MMATQEIQKYVTEKAARTEFVILSHACPPNQDAIVLLLGTPDRKSAAAISISGMERLQNNESQMKELLDVRFENAAAILASIKAA